MRGSAKGEEPEMLRAWKAGQRVACIEPRYGDLSRDAREATRKALFVEQTGQCVYCGRGLDLELLHGHHIEHVQKSLLELRPASGARRRPTHVRERERGMVRRELPCRARTGGSVPTALCVYLWRMDSGGWFSRGGANGSRTEAQSSRTHCRSIRADRVLGRPTQRRRFPWRTDRRFSGCLLDRSKSQFCECGNSVSAEAIRLRSAFIAGAANGGMDIVQFKARRRRWLCSAAASPAPPMSASGARQRARLGRRLAADAFEPRALTTDTVGHTIEYAITDPGEGRAGGIRQCSGVAPVGGRLAFSRPGEGLGRHLEREAHSGSLGYDGGDLGRGAHRATAGARAVRGGCHAARRPRNRRRSTDPRRREC